MLCLHLNHRFLGLMYISVFLPCYALDPFCKQPDSQARIQEFTQGDARFGKGKIIQKRKKETFSYTYLFQIRHDCNVLT